MAMIQQTAYSQPAVTSLYRKTNLVPVSTLHVPIHSALRAQSFFLANR